MLSNRGRTYATLDLAAGYLKERGPLYNKIENPSGLVSLTNAENFLMQEKALDFIKEKCAPSLEASSLTYHDGPFGSKRLRQATVDFINNRFSSVSPVTTEEVSFVSGVTALTNIVSVCVAEENEGLLLGMPIYGSFVPDLQTTSNCKLVYTSFGDVDQFNIHAANSYEQALLEAERSGTKVRALLLTNPHNPLGNWKDDSDGKEIWLIYTGRCYPRETLIAIMRFCNKYGIHLISDEIYALSVYTEDTTHPGFTSVLSIDYTGIIRKDQIHVLYGFSKDFAAAGLRLGCLISRSADLTKAVRSLARFHWAPPMTDAIATTILEDEQFHTQFFEESKCALGKHRAIASRALDDAGIPYVRNANAGLFLWMDLSACLDSSSWEAEGNLKQKLYDYGVEMSSGHAYHDETPGKFRFIFSVEKDTLVEGLRRVVAFYKQYRLDKA